ncbi:MAG: RNA polymerase sigma factor [Bacteroidales bacterium]|nr:RNA polymerase sigma factor [Bacteroidales bacterium]
MNKEERFNQILSENSERIKRICGYYNSDPEDQKDMYQDVLINIWNSLDNFRGESAVSTWIYRIAVNTSLNFTGKVFREMKLIVKEDISKLKMIVDDEGAEKKLKEEENFERLQCELNQLSVIDKALISLVIEGLSMKEIAEIIGITEPNVKVKIHRVKTQLKTKLGV